MEPISEKRPPSYAIASVDHALRLVATLQLEGRLTVAGAAERLGVSRSSAHRILQMLVYRDFAVQDDQRVYRPGLLLELDAHSPSRTAQLRRTALPHLKRLRDAFEESVNLSIPNGATTRFIASVECRRTPSVTSREGMVYPLYPTTTGLLHLAYLSDPELRAFLSSHPHLRQQPRVAQDVERVRRGWFAVNQQRTEKGLVAVGVPVRGTSGELLAGLSVTMPTLRYDERQLGAIINCLRTIGADLEEDFKNS